MHELQLVREQQGEDQGLIDDYGDLHKEDELAAVNTVGDRTAQRGDDEHGNGDDEVDDTEGEGVVVRQVVGEDGAHEELRHHREHEADVADVEPAELLVAERGDQPVPGRGVVRLDHVDAGTGHARVLRHDSSDSP